MADGWRFCWWTVDQRTGTACGRPAIGSRKVAPQRVTDPDGTVRTLPGYEMGVCAKHAAEFDQAASEAAAG